MARKNQYVFMSGALFFVIFMGVLILLKPAFPGELYRNYEILSGVSLLIGAVFFMGSPFIFDEIDEDVGFELSFLVPVVPALVFAYNAAGLLCDTYSGYPDELFMWAIPIMGILLAIRYPTFKVLSLPFFVKAASLILFIASGLLFGWPGLEVISMVLLVVASALCLWSSMMLCDEWTEYREKIRAQIRRSLGRR